MNFILRPYQKECIETLNENFKTEKYQLIQLPTGSGKTVIFWEYITKYAKSALILVPSITLAEQVMNVSQHFIDKSKISCKYGKKRHIKNFKDYHVTTFHSFKSFIKQNEKIQKKFDIVVIDECHRSKSTVFEKQLNKFSNYERCFGVTATPYRLDERNLMEIFSCISFKKSLNEMIEEGYLCDLIGKRIETKIKLSSNVKSNDFSSTFLSKNLCNAERNNIIVDSYSRNCTDRKTIIFCIDISHCEKLKSIFLEKGYLAESIHQKKSHSDRKRILSDFKEGKINILLNVQMLTEGFDEPSIQAVIIARPTMSKALYTQMVGRGTRIYPGKKNCLIIDICDNYYNLCTFLSLSFPNHPNIKTNKSHKDFLSIKEINKNIEQFLTIVDSYDEKEFNFNEFNTEKVLKKINYEHKEIEYPEWITWEESLFIRWKKRKMEEFLKSGLYPRI